MCRPFPKCPLVTIHSNIHSRPVLTRISCVVEHIHRMFKKSHPHLANTSLGYLIILVSHSNLCIPHAKTKSSLLLTTSDIYNLCPPMGTRDMTTLSCDCIDGMHFLFFISCSMTKQLHVYHPPSHLPYAHTHIHTCTEIHMHIQMHCMVWATFV